MSNFEFVIFFLVVYLIILVIYKIIFWLTESSDKPEKEEKLKKIKTIEAEGFGIANYEENKSTEEDLTTYLVKDKKRTSKLNYNSEDEFGNYMQDVLVLNQPIPEQNRLIINSQDNLVNNSINSEKNTQIRDNEEIDKFSNDESLFDKNINLKFEELVNETPINKENVIQEYKGLSKEMKMFLIAKILDRKISM